MAKYGSYKDSGVKWLGEIPSHWEVKRAKTIFFKHKRPVRKEDEIVTCFRDGEVTLRKNRRTEGFTNADKEFGYQGIRKGDLVIHEMDAFAGAIGVSDSDGKSTPVYTVCTTRNKDNLVYYYSHIIRIMSQRGFIQSLSKGIRERSTAFSYDIFGNQLLPIPTSEEQEAIVKYLDKVTGDIDKSIESQQKMIETLNERKQIIITKAVTKGLNPNVPLKDSGIDWLGQIPAHWELLQIRRVAKVKTGKTPSSSNPEYYENQDIIWYTPGDFKVSTIYLDDSERKLDKRAKKEIKLFPASSVLLVGIGGTLGKVGFTKKECFSNQQINALIPNKRCEGRFLTYMLTALKEYIIISSNSATLPILNQDATKRLFIVLPPIEEQISIINSIERNIEPIEKMISNCEKMITLLQERKQIIINEVVTGKKKVI